MAQSVRPGTAASWQLDVAARKRSEPDGSGSGWGPLLTLGRWLALAASAAALGASYFLPWWTFTLYAPQYPGGLRLVVSLSKVSGDVQLPGRRRAGPYTLSHFSRLRWPSA